MYTCMYKCIMINKEIKRSACVSEQGGTCGIQMEVSVIKAYAVRVSGGAMNLISCFINTPKDRTYTQT